MNAIRSSTNAIPGLDRETASIGLRIVGGSPRGDIEISDGEVLFGREAVPPGNLDNDPTLSRRHARILRGSAGAFILEDLASTNGTYVNGERLIGPRIIGPGDEVRMGGTDLVVVDLDGRLSATAVLQLKQGPAIEHDRSAAANLLPEGRRLYEAQRWNEAEAIFKRVAATAPEAEAAEGRYGAGLVRLRLGDTGEAVSLFEQCLEGNPGHANALYQLGRIQAELGSAASAREFFERALLANPQHASARSELSRYSESTSSSREAPGQQSSLDSDAAYRKYGPYEFLLQDGSPLSRDTIKVMDALRMRRHPRMSAFLGKLLRRLLVVLGGVLLTVAAPKTGAPDPQKAFETLGLALAAVGTLSALRTVLLISTTRVTIDKGRLQIEKGILARRLTNIELWRVEDIDFRQTLLNRVTGDGILIIHPLPRARGNAKDIVVPGLARGRKLREMHQELLNLTWLLRSSPAVKGVIY